MIASRESDIERLRRVCANCGKPFGFHGAARPHNCPTEATSAGRYPDPTTNFKAEFEEVSK